ncbi:Crp/Fnr family transcriptional regulator [Peptoniphilus mikwangii]|uniref:Crp/Fnr family transcriptional regulator n=1 Tax=Peptoniphilus mikwangii TaxID=1354300 RepID=UPI000402CB94|nr:Crp/Fnr family transcriptional regulator [Peptoniphilus mikwangii]
MDTIDYKKTPLLKYLTEEEIKRFISKPQIKEFKKGEYIFRSKDEARQMYIVYDGFMKISMFLSDGREQILYIYKEGDFVGGFNIISGDRYVYTSVALTDTKIIIIHKEDFEDILLKNVKILRKLLDQSYYRIRKSEELIDRLSVINADMKVAKLLIDLIKICGKKKNNKILLDLNINREELGSYTGVSRETISRKLNHFETMNIISLLPKGKILIEDLEALYDMTI